MYLQPNAIIPREDNPSHSTDNNNNTGGPGPLPRWPNLIIGPIIIAVSLLIFLFCYASCRLNTRAREGQEAERQIIPRYEWDEEGGSYRRAEQSRRPKLGFPFTERWRPQTPRSGHTISNHDLRTPSPPSIKSRLSRIFSRATEASEPPIVPLRRVPTPHPSPRPPRFERRRGHAAGDIRDHTPPLPPAYDDHEDDELLEEGEHLVDRQEGITTPAPVYARLGNMG